MPPKIGNNTTQPTRKERKSQSFIFREINLTDWQEMDRFLANTGVISNFTCFPQLWAFAVKPESDHLYFFQGSANEKPRLILYRRRKTPDGRSINDLRILFERKDDDKDLISALKKKFKPDYLAYNLIPGVCLPIPYPNSQERHELIIDLKTIANLEVKELARAYRRCQRRHPQLRVVEANPDHLEAINQFLDEWCQSAGVKLEKNPTAANDRRFIRLFLGNPQVRGYLVFDGNKIIGIAFHTYHPSTPGLAVKVILKNLRGYAKLGQWFMVEEARKLLTEGFSQALTGGDEIPSQAKFKKQFMTGGKRQTYYSFEVFRSPGFSLPKNFLRDIWA